MPDVFIYLQGPFIGQPNHGRPLYVCCNRRDRTTGAKKCPASSVGAERLDRTILAAVEDVMTNERKLGATAAQHRSELAAGVNAPEIERLRERLEQLRRRQDKARGEALKAAETGDAEAEAFYEREAREASAQRIELQSQLRAKTVVVEFRVDVAAIARAVREGLRKASRSSSKSFSAALSGASLIGTRKADIEFVPPVNDAQYCQREQAAVDSFILLKIKRRVA